MDVADAALLSSPSPCAARGAVSPDAAEASRAATAAFVRFDCGEKGYLTRHELRCAHVALLGHPPSLVRARRPRTRGGGT